MANKIKLYTKDRNDSIHLIRKDANLMEANLVALQSINDRKDNRVYIPDVLHLRCMIGQGMIIEPKSEKGNIVDNKVISIWHDSNTLAYVLRPESCKEQDEIDLDNYRKDQKLKQEEAIKKQIESRNHGT